MNATCAPLLALLLHVPLAAGQDTLVTSDHEALRGTVTGFGRDAFLIELSGGRTRAIPLEALSHVTFGAQPLPAGVGTVRVQTLLGWTLTAAKLGFAKESGISLAGPIGAVRLDRGQVRSIAFQTLDGTPPEIKDGEGDVAVVRRSADAEELQAVTGELLTISEDALTLRVAGDKEERLPRSIVRVIYFRKPSSADEEAPQGRFARIQLRNGDRFSATITSADRDRIRFFSHLLGPLELAKTDLHSVRIVPSLRLLHSFLVCEQNRVREFDGAGRALWQYTNNVAYAWCARRLENGNVLIVNTNYGTILEVRPKGASGGDVVWKLEGLNHPYDARRLDSGNTLVTEYYSGKVTEYGPDRSVVWQTKNTQQPVSAQRLENGHTLVAYSGQVVEFSAKQEEMWKASVRNAHIWRAERLENGNTLIVDMSRGQVVEVDPRNQEVWRKAGLQRPVFATRLDDGTTLIVEQGKNAILQVDAAGRSGPFLSGLQSPLCVTTR